MLKTPLGDFSLSDPNFARLVSMDSRFVTQKQLNYLLQPLSRVDSTVDYLKSIS